MGIVILSACMSVHQLCVIPKKTKKRGIMFSGTSVTDSCEPLLDTGD